MVKSISGFQLYPYYNANRTKNGKVTRFAPLELEINKYKEHINIAVTDLNGMDISLEYNQLAKNNTEVNWNSERIQLMRCPKEYRTQD